MRILAFVFAVTTLPVLTSSQAVGTNLTVETFAGSDFEGTVDGQGTRTMFSRPQQIAVDQNGTIYVSQSQSDSTVRIITQDATVTTAAYRFLGTRLLIGDQNGLYGLYSGVSGAGPAGEYGIYGLQGKQPTLAFVAVGKVAVWNSAVKSFFVADRVIRKVSAVDQSVFVGSGNQSQLDGSGLFCSFMEIRAMAVNVAGELIVVDHQSLRRVTMSGDVTTIKAEGAIPITSDILALSDGRFLFVDRSRIMVIAGDGNLSVLAGGVDGYKDGTADVALFKGIGGIALAPNGDVFVSDSGNNRIRRIRMPKGEQVVPPSQIAIQPFVGITIQGIPGRSYRIEASTEPVSGNWQTRATLQLTTNPFTWLDQTPATAPKYFYRVITIE